MIRPRQALLAACLLFSVGACERNDDRFATATGTSAFLDDASPDAREALSIQVDYILTDEKFRQWEAAQRNLDRLPRSAFPTQRSSPGGNAIDRAVARLESSPKARSTIEATGLTVRDFVLQTVALAQATEVAESGRPAGAGLVPPENFRFVDRYRARIRRAQTAARMARRNAEAELQFDAGVGEGDGGDTSIAAGAGMDASSSVTETRIERADPTQSSNADSSISSDVRESEPTPRDTTRDSLSVDDAN